MNKTDALLARSKFRQTWGKIATQQREIVFGAMGGWMNGEPVWSHDDIIRKWGSQFQDWLQSASIPAGIAGSAGVFAMRSEFIATYGFAVPSAELMATLKVHAPILEVGAGIGYMTKLMRNCGINVTGSDPMRGLSLYGFAAGAHDPDQLKLSGGTVVGRPEFAGRSVFCSWPSQHEPWFARMLRRLAVGQRLIVIREECTGTKAAWSYLEKRFQFEQDIRLPVWPGLHDRAEVWVKWDDQPVRTN